MHPCFLKNKKKRLLLTPNFGTVVYLISVKRSFEQLLFVQEEPAPQFFFDLGQNKPQHQQRHGRKRQIDGDRPNYPKQPRKPREPFTCSPSTGLMDQTGLFLLPYVDIFSRMYFKPCFLLSLQHSPLDPVGSVLQVQKSRSTWS